MIGKIFESITGDNEWDENDILSIILYNMRCIKDFGVFKKGQEYQSITIDFNKGFIQTHDDNGDVLQEVKMRLEPVE